MLGSFFSQSHSADLTVPREDFSVQFFPALSLKEKPHTIVLIQDIHLHTETQKKIVTLIKQWNDEKKIGGVYVEGAQGYFQFGSFRKFSLELRRKVAEAFLKTKKIAGISFIGLTEESFVSVFGVDEENLYQENLKHYLSAVSSGEALLQEFLDDVHSLHREKTIVFNSALLSFDQLVYQYRKNKITLLNFLSSRFVFSSIANFKNLARFQQASLVELGLDFKQIEKEKVLFLTELGNVSNQKEKEFLLHFSFFLQQKKISLQHYLKKLFDLAHQKRIDVRQYSVLLEYEKYLGIIEEIDGSQLFEEVDNAIQLSYRQLIQNEIEKKVVEQSEDFYLLEKLLFFSMTPFESKKLKGKIPKSSPYSPHALFYETADLRSIKMAQNILENLSNGNEKRKPVVFIGGGFHVPEMKEILQDRCHTIILTPKVRSIEVGTTPEYFSLFHQEKTPLEKLISAQYLSLIPQKLLIGANSKPAMLSSMMYYLYLSLLSRLGSGEKIAGKIGSAELEMTIGDSSLNSPPSETLMLDGKRVSVRVQPSSPGLMGIWVLGRKMKLDRTLQIESMLIPLLIGPFFVLAEKYQLIAQGLNSFSAEWFSVIFVQSAYVATIAIIFVFLFHLATGVMQANKQPMWGILISALATLRVSVSFIFIPLFPLIIKLFILNVISFPLAVGLFILTTFILGFPHSFLSRLQLHENKINSFLTSNARSAIIRNLQPVVSFFSDRSLLIHSSAVEKIKFRQEDLPVPLGLLQRPLDKKNIRDVDTMIILGSHFLRVPEYAARILFEIESQNQIKRIIFTGKGGHRTPKEWGQTEASFFKSIFIKQCRLLLRQREESRCQRKYQNMHSLKARFLTLIEMFWWDLMGSKKELERIRSMIELEVESTNTGQNIEFTSKVILKDSLDRIPEDKAWKELLVRLLELKENKNKNETEKKEMLEIEKRLGSDEPGGLRSELMPFLPKNFLLLTVPSFQQRATDTFPQQYWLPYEKVYSLAPYDIDLDQMSKDDELADEDLLVMVDDMVKQLEKMEAYSRASPDGPFTFPSEKVIGNELLEAKKKLLTLYDLYREKIPNEKEDNKFLSFQKLAIVFSLFSIVGFAVLSLRSFVSLSEGGYVAFGISYFSLLSIVLLLPLLLKKFILNSNSKFSGRFDAFTLSVGYVLSFSLFSRAFVSHLDDLSPALLFILFLIFLLGTFSMTWSWSLLSNNHDPVVLDAPLTSSVSPVPTFDLHKLKQLQSSSYRPSPKKIVAIGRSFITTLFVAVKLVRQFLGSKNGVKYEVFFWNYLKKQIQMFQGVPPVSQENIEKAAAAAGIEKGSPDFLYLLGLYRQYVEMPVGPLHNLRNVSQYLVSFFRFEYQKNMGYRVNMNPDKMKRKMILDRDNPNGNFLMYSMLTDAEQANLGFIPYDDISRDPDLDVLQNATATFTRLEGGIGESMPRDAEVLRSKGVDLMFEKGYVNRDGDLQKKKITLAMGGLSQFMKKFKKGVRKIARVVYEPYVSKETETYYTDELLEVANEDQRHRNEDGQPIDSNRKVLRNDGIDYGYTYQKKLPKVVRDDLSLSTSQPVDHKTHQTGGHGHPAFHFLFHAMKMYRETMSHGGSVTPHVRVIANGDNLNSHMDENNMADMIKNKIPLSLVAVTAQEADIKGGKFGAVYDEHSKQWLLDLMEFQQAVDAGQKTEFLMAGQPGDPRKVRNQKFNTNMLYINEYVIGEILHRLSLSLGYGDKELGDIRLAEILTPVLIRRDFNKDGFANLDGGLASVVLGLNRYIQTNKTAKNILLTVTGHSYLVKVVDLDEKDVSQRFKNFSPIKLAVDYAVLTGTDRFVYDSAEDMFHDMYPNDPIPAFILNPTDPSNTYYKPIPTARAAFGEQLLIRGLRKLTVHGKVKFPDMSFSGVVEIDARSVNREIDLSQLIASQPDLFKYRKRVRLILNGGTFLESEKEAWHFENVKITIDQNLKVTLGEIIPSQGSLPEKGQFLFSHAIFLLPFLALSIDSVDGYVSPWVFDGFPVGALLGILSLCCIVWVLRAMKPHFLKDKYGVKAVSKKNRPYGEKYLDNRTRRFKQHLKMA
ncbi:MAG: hypothetical protein ACKVQC_05240 [Elusimicrobiota bacterium]